MVVLYVNSYEKFNIQPFQIEFHWVFPKSVNWMSVNTAASTKWRQSESESER